MQINTQVMKSQINTSDKPLELKQGEVYRATVKERVSESEAVLQIRGKEINAKFDEGRLPSQERVTVQVFGQDDQIVRVKAITTNSSASASQVEVSNTSQAIRNLGVSNPSKDLQQAAQIILDKGVPLNRDSVQSLQRFIESENGTIEQRLNSVQAIANKRLEVTSNHLNSVHEALHGRPLNEVLNDIAKELDPKFEIKAEVKASDDVQQVREQVQRETNVQRAIEQVRNEVVNNPRVDREVAREVERAVDEARALVQTGRGEQGRERIVQALRTAEQELARMEQRLESTQEVRVSEDVRQVREQVQREPNV
ncbi:MAG: hypothetical protein LRY71_04000, partial [Bacillaceae bacterium]|nr:hypothetical protein [Bacillaceae bacterium]